METGEKKISTRSCYSVAQIWWNEKEPCWEFESVGTRFLEEYQEGLCEFVLKWIELTDLTREFTEAKRTTDEVKIRRNNNIYFEKMHESF